ncbi:MAG: aspartate aminotransferase family protein [Candidatus Thermoplasmatota archaeon]
MTPESPFTMPAGEERLLRGFAAKELIVERAENATLWTADGKSILDFGGASHGVALVGHNHPRVVAAIQAQAGRLLHVAQGVPNPERATFLRLLHEPLPPPLTRSFLANSGAEAMECALKLSVAATGRSRFVAAKDGFHGRTAAALAVTHRAAFREPFQSILPGADFVPFNDEEALKTAVSSQTAALVLEPVQGEGGVRAATDRYLRAARDIATDAGALLVFDEVQSGLGRTGSFLACEPSGVVPDLVTLAKGLAGGLPIGTCSMTEAVAAKLPPGGHGSTYGGAPLACAAASEVLRILDDEKLAARARRLGASLLERLRGLNHPVVREVRGSGLMAGIELRIRPQPAMKALQERGFLVLAGGTTGLRLLPPLTVAESDLDRFVEVLPQCLA